MAKNRPRTTALLPVAGCGLIALVLWQLFGRPPWMERTLDVNALAERARGITSDTPVYKDGFVIGSVKNVQTTNATGQSVTMVLRLSTSARVIRGDGCFIVEPDGHAYLEFALRHDAARADWKLVREG